MTFTSFLRHLSLFNDATDARSNNSMLVLPVVRPECTLTASQAEYDDGTDGQTDGRQTAT